MYITIYEHKKEGIEASTIKINEQIKNIYATALTSIIILLIIIFFIGILLKNIWIITLSSIGAILLIGLS